MPENRCPWNRYAVAFLALTALPSPGAAWAGYPERPIRWIVAAAAGGGADASVRVIAPELSQLLGQQVVIDNRPGASGTIGIALIAKAAADGHTIGSGSISNIVMNRSTRPDLPYDPDNDLQAAVQTHFQPNVLAVTPSLPVKSITGLIDYAKKNPGKLLYSSSGNGSSLHFAGELFQIMSGTQLGHIPYNSVPVALNDLFAGRVPLIFNNMSSTVPHIKAGRVRGLGVTSLKRSPIFPDLPTISDSGLPGYELVVWSGIVVPAGTPRPIIERLNAAINRVLDTPDVRQKLIALGLELVGGASESFAQLIRRETRKWAEVAKRAGIRPE